MQRLTTLSVVQSAHQQITILFESYFEWFYFYDGHSVQLKRGELEVNIFHGNLILSCWTEKGTRSWRVRSWCWAGDRLVLEASRRMGAERPLIELIPRASAASIAATVMAAREARCRQLAQLACQMLPIAKLERAGLSRGIRPGQPGRYARIILRQGHKRVAVTASVSTHQAGDADAFLSSALLWFASASDRINGPYLGQLVLVVQGELLRAVLAKLPFLRQAIRGAICVWKIDDSWSELEVERVPERNELWRKRLPRFPPHNAQATSQSANEIIALAPEAIDSVQSKKGETLRYFGLPFARVRKLLGRERTWFGLDYPTRKLLENKTFSEWSSLLEELREHRKADAADRRHALYRNASEAWLEALLRRDISKLDPGMVVAPIYAQFRTAMGGRSGVRPIDLLALRQDGRLVVIELKAFEDREHVFQGVGYWQRVEAHRRRGHLASANLFDSRTITDEPPLVYLVAPTLRVHPAFQKLASFVSRDIEIYRFDISEDWRSGVRVMRRLRVN